MSRTSTTSVVTIPNGGSVSGVVLLGQTLVMVVTPAAWDAASLTFQVSLSETSGYADLYDDAGAEVVVAAAASRAIHVDPAVFAGARYIRVRSGTAAAAVNQTAARQLTLIAAPILG